MGNCNCPNCGRDVDEREVDWTEGYCRFCESEVEDDEED